MQFRQCQIGRTVHNLVRENFNTIWNYFPTQLLKNLVELSRWRGISNILWYNYISIVLLKTNQIETWFNCLDGEESQKFYDIII